MVHARLLLQGVALPALWGRMQHQLPCGNDRRAALTCGRTW
jgi:hypothetical protein